MIYGIGTDILNIHRIAATMERTEGRLAEKILGPQEMKVYQARSARNASRGLAYLATRFAAKEAFSKAIGLGMCWPMTWRAMQTLNDPTGKPYVVTSGELATWMEAKQLVAHITLTDEKDNVIAFAVTETRDGAASQALQATVVLPESHQD